MNFVQFCSIKDLRMVGLHVSVILTNNMALAAKQDLQKWKENAFNFTWFLFDRRVIKPSLNYPVRSFNFPMWYRLCPHPSSFSWHAKRYVIYAWIVHHWIMNHRVVYCKSEMFEKINILLKRKYEFLKGQTHKSNI